ncbi:uncharacterized protein LOC113351074 [Papaver somniferum]|uniref:uncharacterized protein LOC113351074 n=1 Tax=Papaver somniferum TaxID=3469 RepID=UPI000E6F7D4C|nr:uncharacterized protein LOC113351074 [Papaver somniferum]
MAKYLTPEDVAITEAWISITLDGVAGVDQNSNQFWERVFDTYVSIFGNKNDRTVHKLQNRFGTLKKDLKKWVGILRNLHRNNASGCGNDDLERKARLEYSKVSKGKPFQNEEVYRLSKAHVLGFNPEEIDPTQNVEDESDAPSFNASTSSAPARSDPRWHEEDGPRRPTGKRAQQREASELSAINNGTERILKHFSEENAKKMAILDGREEYLLTITKTKKKSVDLALEKHELEVLYVVVETLPEWKQQFMLDKQNKILEKHGYPPRTLDYPSTM